METEKKEENNVSYIYRDFLTKADFIEFKHDVKERFDKVDARFDKIDTKFENMRKEMKYNLYALGGLLITLLEIIPNWPHIKVWIFG